MIQERIRHEFNRWADQGRGRGLEKGNWETTRQLIELMRVNDHDNILDLGCGLGWATRLLAQKASRGIVLGMDLSDRMVVRARTASRNPHNALYVVGDAAGIPCPDAFFNLVLSVESIYYSPGLDLAFHEVHRILKPRRKALFLISYYKENVYGHEWAKHIDIPVHLLGAEDYVAVLRDTGFTTIRHRRIIDSTPLPEDWTPTHWFPTREHQMKFRSEGSLLLTAKK
jgi:SAM-dependent methyltransferase